MRAAVYRGRGRIEVEERPLPAPGPGDALLRVSHCGVCGTDLHMVLDGWGRPDTVGGHEYSGRIAALGSEVRGWRLGDAAVGGPEPGCGRCRFCRSQRPALCEARSSPLLGADQGAFAEYVRVPAARLLRVPAGLGLREAALAEPLAVALHAITLAAPPPGARALVCGAGPIGALIVAALRARGVAELVVSEPRALRRALAARLGASRVVDPAELEAPRLPFDQVAEPCDVAFECSGQPAALGAALAQLRGGGRLVLLGTGIAKPPLDASRLLLNELSLTGAYTYDENGIADALALLASGALPSALLLEAQDVPLEGILPAMHALAEGRIAAKVLVAPAAGGDS
jgi:(R,R)-butanediol dehydrogenase/meso-butanediol dehydrogenase/diacetyl reductase